MKYSAFIAILYFSLNLECYAQQKHIHSMYYDKVLSDFRIGSYYLDLKICNKNGEAQEIIIENTLLYQWLFQNETHNCYKNKLINILADNRCYFIDDSIYTSIKSVLNQDSPYPTQIKALSCSKFRHFRNKHFKKSGTIFIGGFDNRNNNGLQFIKTCIEKHYLINQESDSGDFIIEKL